MPLPIKWIYPYILTGSDWNDVRIYKPCSYIVFCENGTYYAQGQWSGSTDYSGSNFSTVISNVLTATRASASGSRIFLRAGTYPSISFNDPYNLELVGEGQEKTIIHATTDVPCIYFNRTGNTPGGRSNLVIRDMRITGNGSGSTNSHGIHLDNGVWRVILDNITFTNCRDAVRLVEVGWIEARDLFIDSDIGYNYNGIVGITTTNGILGYFDRIFVIRPQNDGFHFDSLNAAMFNDCEVLEPGNNGFYAGPIQGGGISTLVNCQFDVCHGIGIYLNGASYTQLIGTYAGGSSYGDGTPYGQALNISNSIYVRVVGGDFWGGKTPIIISGSWWISLSDVQLRCHRGSPPTAYQYSGIIISGSHDVALSNVFIDSLACSGSTISAIEEQGTNTNISLSNVFLTDGGWTSPAKTYNCPTAQIINSDTGSTFNSVMTINNSVYVKSHSLYLDNNNTIVMGDTSSPSTYRTAFKLNNNNIWEIGDAGRDIQMKLWNHYLYLYTGSLLFDNNQGLYWKDTYGVNRNLEYLDATNSLLIGDNAREIRVKTHPFEFILNGPLVFSGSSITNDMIVFASGANRDQRRIVNGTNNFGVYNTSKTRWIFVCESGSSGHEESFNMYDMTIKNPSSSAATTVSGLQKVLKVDIGGTIYNIPLYTGSA